jgi:hypothetical protein
VGQSGNSRKEPEEGKDEEDDEEPIKKAVVSRSITCAGRTVQ